MTDEQINIQEAIKMLKSHNAGIRFNACRMLYDAQGITPEAKDALRNALTDTDVAVAKEAKKALVVHLSSKSSQDAAVSPLSPAPYEEVREDIQKWEHRWEFVFLDEGEYVLVVNDTELTGRAVWNYLASLGKKGWELVSVAPQIGDTNPQRGKASTVIGGLFDFAIAGPRLTPATQHKTGTTGYFFWYKRPIRMIHCPICNAELLYDSVFCTKCGSKIVV